MKGWDAIERQAREHREKLEESRIEALAEQAFEEAEMFEGGMDCYGSIDDAYPEWSGSMKTTRINFV